MKKEGDIYSLLPISKSIMHQVCYYLRKYHIPLMGVVALGVIVPRVVVLGVVVPGVVVIEPRYAFFCMAFVGRLPNKVSFINIYVNENQTAVTTICTCLLYESGLT